MTTLNNLPAEGSHAAPVPFRKDGKATLGEIRGQPPHSISLTKWGPILEALGQVESDNRDHAIGPAGEVSRYQVLPSIWAKLGSKLSPTNPKHSAFLARMILTERMGAWQRKHGGVVPPVTVYKLWAAPGDAMVGACSKSVQERAERFSNLVAALSLTH